MPIKELLGAVFGFDITVTDEEGGSESNIFVTPELWKAVKEVTGEILSTLTPREKEIVKMRFGLDESGAERSRQEVARHFNVSSTRIGQFEIKALMKLRHPSRSRKIYSLLKSQQTHTPSEPTPAELNEAIETVKKLTPELIRYLKSHEQDLLKIDPYVFEHLVGEFLVQMGFQDVWLVGKEWKTSADIYAVEKVNALGVRIRYFVEVKREKNKIGVDVIDKVYGAMIGERTKYGWNAAMIVSVVGFTNIKKYSPAEIERMGIYLKDQDEILKWLRAYQPNKDGLWLPDPNKKLLA